MVEKKKYPKGKPVLRNGSVDKASICSWDVEFSFLTREQCLKFINLWLTEFTPETGIEYNQLENLHVIKISCQSWAHNLTLLAQLLELCDYNDGLDEE